LPVLTLLALLLFVVSAGLEFTAHALWVVAVVLLVLGAIGLVVGRGEASGCHRFYRW
jgi:hypothetical protein